MKSWTRCPLSTLYFPSLSLEMGLPYGMNHPPHCCPSFLWGGLKGHPIPIAPKLLTQETPVQAYRGVSAIQHVLALAALKIFLLCVLT